MTVIVSVEFMSEWGTKGGRLGRKRQIEGDQGTEKDGCGVVTQAREARRQGRDS